MCTVIAEENELLKKIFHCVMKKTNSPKEFMQVKSGLFLYCCDVYDPMSSVTVILLQRCGIYFKKPTLGELEPGYLPFFGQ